MSKVLDARQLDRGSLALLCLSHLFDDITQGALPAMLPFFIAAHNLSYSAAAGLVLAITVSSSVLQPLLGQYSDKRPAPWLAPAGMVLAGLGVAVSTVMPTYPLMLLAVGLTGVGVAAFHPEAARFANYVSGERRATGMSIFALGGNLGFATGPLLATPLVLAFGLPGGLLLAVPPTIMALILASQLPRLSALSRSVAAAARAGASRAAQVDDWSLFGLVTGAVILRSILFQGLNTFVPLYWHDVLRQPAAAGSFALTLLFVSGATGTLAGGVVADRWGRRRTVLAGFIAVAVLLAILVQLEDPAVAMLLLAPIGFVLFVPMSVMVVMAQEALPNRIGIASGVTMGLAVSVGGFAAPFLGSLADTHGIHAVLVGLVALPVLALGFLVPLPKDKALAA